MLKILNPDYFKNILNSPAQKRLAENFISLSFLQMVNYILPLLTLPYLVRVLGAEKFGLIAFAQAFIGFFFVITDYGFAFSATKEISINRDKKEKVSEIFNSVIASKLLLGGLGFAVLLAILLFVPKFRNDWMLYALTFWLVVENIIFPIWLFQGLEKMRYITSLNLVSKLIYTISIFIFIKNTGDYIYVPLISLATCLVTGVFCWRIIRDDLGVKIGIPSPESVRRQLKEGWHIFVSILAINIYYTGMPFILGLLTNNAAVGYYSAGEKIIKALEGIFAPVSKTVYPHLSRISQESKFHAVSFSRKLLKIVSSATILLSLAVLIWTPQISTILLGDQYEASVIVIRILASLIFIRQAGYIFLFQIMPNFGHERAIISVSLSALATSLIASFVLIPSLKETGAALAVLFSDTVVLIISALFVQKNYHFFNISGKITEESKELL